MKVYLINLDKNPERLAATKCQLDKLGVPFERVSAVYGRDLAEQDKRAAVNRFRWWCAQGREIRDGEIGVALSQYGIYRRMIKEKTKMACILEDDNRYRDTFKCVLERVSEAIDWRKPQVVLLSNCSKDRPASDGFSLVPALKDQWASSYVITLPAARAILKANYPLHVPCDYWRRWVKRGIIELYHAFPTVAVQDGHANAAFGIPLGAAFKSDIECGEVFRVRNLCLVKKLLHKLKRCVGVLVDRMLPL